LESWRSVILKIVPCLPQGSVGAFPAPLGSKYCLFLLNATAILSKQLCFLGLSFQKALNNRELFGCLCKRFNNLALFFGLLGELVYLLSLTLNVCDDASFQLLILTLENFLLVTEFLQLPLLLLTFPHHCLECFGEIDEGFILLQDLGSEEVLLLKKCINLVLPQCRFELAFSQVLSKKPEFGIGLFELGSGFIK
jgi:hypothetical protein